VKCGRKIGRARTRTFSSVGEADVCGLLCGFDGVEYLDVGGADAPSEGNAEADS